MKSKAALPTSKSPWSRGPTLLAVVAAALLFFLCAANGSANVRVNQDNVPPGNVQNTPSIDLDGTTGTQIVGYNDIPGGGTGVGASYWAPANGQWLDSSFPAFGWHGWEQDPCVTADQGGSVFLSQVSYDQFPNNNLSGIYVSRSNDGGASFTSPYQVAYYGQSYPRAVKPKVEADDYGANPGPYDGNVYVIWQEDQSNAFFSDAQLSRSTDAGYSWTMLANPINDSRQDCVTWPDLAIGGDGSVVAGWLDQQRNFTQHEGQIFVDRSTDGAVTWGTDVPAVTFWTVPLWLTDGNNVPKVSARSYASVAVNPSNPSDIGVVYAADPDDGPANEVRIDFGDLPPGTSDAQLLHPLNSGSSISCNRYYYGNYVYSAWTDSRFGVDVFFSRGQIVNGIANWTGDTKLTTEPAGQHVGGYNPVITSSGTNVYVAWDEYAGVDFYRLIWFNRSTDYGATWLTQAVPLDTNMQVAWAALPSISCDGNNVCVAWEASLDGAGSNIYVNYSTDAGWTWQPTEIPVRTGHRSMKPQIAQAANYVVCVWEEVFGTGSDIWASVSMNCGQSWSAPTRLNFNTPIGTSITYKPAICCNSFGGVFVVWDDQRVNNISNPYFAYSNNFGIVWQGDFRLNTGVPAGNNRDYFAQIACDGNYVGVVYESDRALLGGPEDVYMNCSTDGGVTWLNADVRQDMGDAAAAHGSVHPRVSVYDYGYPNNAYFYTTWMDDRNAAPYAGWDIYASYVDFNPVTLVWNWLGGDYRVDVGDQPGTSESWNPHVASDWTGPFYVYRDERNGQGDIYANQFQTGQDEGDVYFIRSTDAGTTWSAPLRVNDDVGTNDQSHPWLDIKPNGIVDVVWYDWRNDPGDLNAEFYMASLLPGAATFNANVPVTNQPIAIPGTGNWSLGDYNWVVVDTVQAHCTWTDTRRANDGQLGDAFYHVVPNPSFGACCLTSGACVMASASNCAGQGGQFMGEGTDCDPDPCYQPIEFYNHNVGEPTMTMTCQGILGFMDGTQSQGSGFIYPPDGLNQLYIGSPWVGLGSDYVANRDYDADPAKEWIVSGPDGYIRVDDSGWMGGTGDSDQDIYAGFTDAAAVASRGLLVDQVSWAYGMPEPADDFVIIQYTVVNESPVPLEDLYVGLFMDFDLGIDPSDDEGLADPAAGLVSLSDPSGIHTGVMLLQSEVDPVPVANTTLIDNPTFVYPNAYILDVDKDAFLRAADPAHILYQSTAPNDYGVLVSAGPFTLAPGEEKRVAFAVVGGTSVEHFQTNAWAAQLTFDRGIVGVPGETSGTITSIRLLPNRPNPFSGATNLFFELPAQEEVQIHLFDVSGRRVRALLDETRGAGRHAVTWDGRDGSGRPVADGIYFVKLTTKGATESRPILLLR